MPMYPLDELNEELNKLDKKIEELHEGITVYSEILEDNLDYTKKEQKLKIIINKFKTELSLVQLQRFVVEARIKNEEEFTKIFKDSKDT